MTGSTSGIDHGLEGIYMLKLDFESGTCASAEGMSDEYCTHTPATTTCDWTLSAAAAPSCSTVDLTGKKLKNI